MKTHTYTYYLSSDTRDSGTIANALFDTNMMTLKDNLTGYTLFVDNITMDVDELTDTHLVFRLTNVFQPNSFNSINKSGSNVIATLINTNVATSRTIDVTTSYQNPNAPIPIDNLPDQLNVVVSNSAGATPLDLTTNANHWTMRLRIEAYEPCDIGY